LHGDVVRTSSITATGGADGALNDADEFGNVRDAASTTGTAIGTGARYGWLGAKLRAADTGNGLVIMGVRVYAPVLGRFLQRDPVYGGNSNAYSYPNDPIAMFDLDGRWSISRWWADRFRPSNKHLVIRNSHRGLHLRNHSIRYESNRKHRFHWNFRWRGENRHWYPSNRWNNMFRGGAWGGVVFPIPWDTLFPERRYRRNFV
jgi:RHS repeat-associated protein